MGPCISTLCRPPDYDLRSQQSSRRRRENSEQHSAVCGAWREVSGANSTPEGHPEAFCTRGGLNVSAKLKHNLHSSVFTRLKKLPTETLGERKQRKKQKSCRDDNRQRCVLSTQTQHAPTQDTHAQTCDTPTHAQDDAHRQGSLVSLLSTTWLLKASHTPLFGHVTVDPHPITGQVTLGSRLTKNAVTDVPVHCLDLPDDVLASIDP